MADDIFVEFSPISTPVFSSDLYQKRFVEARRVASTILLEQQQKPTFDSKMNTKPLRWITPDESETVPWGTRIGFNVQLRGQKNHDGLINCITGHQEVRSCTKLTFMSHPGGHCGRLKKIKMDSLCIANMPHSVSASSMANVYLVSIHEARITILSVRIIKSWQWHDLQWCSNDSC